MADDISKSVLTDFQAKTEQLKNSVTSLTLYLDELNKKQTEMGNGVGKYSEDFKKGTISISNTQKALKEFTTQITENNKTLLSAKGSLQQNKDLLDNLQQQYETLSRSQGDNAKQVKDLNVQIGHLSATIDKQEEKVEKSRKVFDYHTESVKALENAFNKIKESNKAFGPILNDVTEGFNAMKTGLSAVKTGFNSVGSAIKTTGFGLLLLVLESLTEYFTTDKTGIKQFRGAMAALGLVIDGIKNTFGAVKHAIAEAIMNPGETIKKIWNGIIENLGNRFKSLAVILDGVMHFDPKKITDGVLQLTTGVTNGTDKIKTAFTKTKEALVAGGKAIIETYKKGRDEVVKTKETTEEMARKQEELSQQQQRKQEERQRKQKEAADRAKQKRATDLEDLKTFNKNEKDIQTQMNARKAQEILSDYERDIKATKDFYAEKLKIYETFIKTYEKKAPKDAEYKKLNQSNYNKAKAGVGKLKESETAELNTITENFQQSELDKLAGYEKGLKKIAEDARKTARELALIQVDEKYKAEKDAIAKALAESVQRQKDLYNSDDPLNQEKLNKEIAIQKQAKSASTALDNQKTKDKDSINSDFDIKDTQESVTENEANGHDNTALTQQLVLLKMQHDAAVKAAENTGKATTTIDENYAKKKAAIEDQLAQAKIHAGDKFIDAVLKNSKKDSAIYKAAFMAKKATSIADTIISTKRAVLESLKAYSGIPFIGQALGIAQAAFMAGQGAISIAEIAKQKPGFATGGRFVSDGRGALLPGYSRTDNTNAYLRSGEAVVVSEAMRNPWARNLVSAINVAHGGRDFSAPNTGRGYAIGGIFTDGGNANRYYNQPVNDIKDMANTLAYQMINNFPPIYVDVKDVNNQQNILAQTIDRVNL